MQSHRAVLLNCALTATMHGRTADDVVVTALPAPHVYGNVVINGTFLAGGTVVLMERFAPSEALRLIGEHRATLFEGVPAMYAMLLADPALAGADLSSLTRCTVGGQTIPTSTIERWETAIRRTADRAVGNDRDRRAGHHTRPARTRRFRARSGSRCPACRSGSPISPTSHATPRRGEPGELMVRGPIVMLGYHNNPAATAETIEPDGWLHTGDIATMDDTGHVFVVDRRKDMIITGGYNVYPAEVERVLAAHPAVAMVAVGPVPDPVRGELACAYVVLDSGRAPDRGRADRLRRRALAAYKRPRLVRFVDDLPKTSTGKIMRRELIKQFVP